MVPVWCQTLIGLSIAGWLLRRAFLRFLTIRPLAGIPCSGVSGRPYGDAPDLVKHFQETGSQLGFFDECYKKYGGLFQLSLGVRRLVVVNDPAIMQDVAIRRSPSEFDRDILSLDIFGTLVPKGQLATISNAMFKAHRRAIAPAIGSAHLSVITPIIADAARELLKLWDLKRALFRDAPFSVKDDFTACLTDTLGKVVLGETFGCMDAILSACQSSSSADFEPNEHNGFDQIPNQQPEFFFAADYMNKAIGNALLAPSIKIHMFMEAFKPRWRSSRKFVKATLARSLARVRREANDEKFEVKSVLEMLVEKEMKGKLDMNDDDEILDELYILLFGGSDTTATTLAWGVKILARHPDFQRELRGYLRQRLRPLDEHLPTHADLSADAVPLLEATTYELIRLSRAVGGGARTTVKDTTIDGHFLPKGSIVLLSTSAMVHEREPPEPYDEIEARKVRGCGYWKDADPATFDPKRWLDAEGHFDGRAGPFSSFGMGSRGCWGRSMAIVQIKTFLAILSLSIFLDSVPQELDSPQQVVTVVTKYAISSTCIWCCPPEFGAQTGYVICKTCTLAPLRPSQVKMYCYTCKDVLTTTAPCHEPLNLCIEPDAYRTSVCTRCRSGQTRKRSRFPTATMDPDRTGSYVWQGKVEEEAETLLTMKTTSGRAQDLVALIQQMHSYDTPEIVVMTPESVSKKYLEWLEEVVAS